MRDYEYVALEVPLGKPQVRYLEEGERSGCPGAAFSGTCASRRVTNGSSLAIQEASHQRP